MKIWTFVMRNHRRIHDLSKDCTTINRMNWEKQRWKQQLKAKWVKPKPQPTINIKTFIGGLGGGTYSNIWSSLARYYERWVSLDYKSFFFSPNQVKTRDIGHRNMSSSRNHLSHHYWWFLFSGHGTAHIQLRGFKAWSGEFNSFTHVHYLPPLLSNSL